MQWIDAFLDFLESATHQALYSRSIYPDSVFVKRLKFGVPLMKCNHPWIREYIQLHLTSIKKVLQETEAAKVRIDLVITLPNGQEEVIAFQVHPQTLRDYSVSVGMNNLSRNFVVKKSFFVVI